MDGVAFYLLAAGTLAAAFGAASGSRLLHSALLLTAAFIGTGCLYILLDADFLGAVQFMVYSGGVAIIIVMGIMLTHRSEKTPSSPDHDHKLPAFGIVGLFAILMLTVYSYSPLRTTEFVVEDTVNALADMMLTHYVLPFEIAAVLLLVAMIGAIILAKGEDEV